MNFHPVRVYAGEDLEALRLGSESHERGAIREQVLNFRSLHERRLPFHPRRHSSKNLTPNQHLTFKNMEGVTVTRCYPYPFSNSHIAHQLPLSCVSEQSGDPAGPREAPFIISPGSYLFAPLYRTKYF